MTLKAAWQVIKQAVLEFSQDRVLRLSAATAYYAIFSIGPLLVLMVGVAGLVFGQQNVRHEVQRQMQALVGRDSAKMIESMMTVQHQGGSLVATILGGIALVFGATGVFGQLQDSLNTIWGVTTKPGKSIWAFIRDRFFSMAMVLGIGFLLLVSLALSAFVNAFSRYLGGVLSVPEWLLPVLNGVLSFVVISVFFALVFKVLPDVKIRWRDVWAGAVATAALFTIGKFLLGYYLSRELSASAYGAGSSFVVILMYVYYASVILYFGAELTKAHIKGRGVHVSPSTYAVKLTDEERAEQGIPTQKQVEDSARRQPRPAPTGDADSSHRDRREE